MEVVFKAGGCRLEYNVSGYVTWPTILEEAVFPALLGLGYQLPPVEAMMEAIGEVWAGDCKSSGIGQKARAYEDEALDND